MSNTSQISTATTVTDTFCVHHHAVSHIKRDFDIFTVVTIKIKKTQGILKGHGNILESKDSVLGLNCGCLIPRIHRAKKHTTSSKHAHSFSEKAPSGHITSKHVWIHESPLQLHVVLTGFQRVQQMCGSVRIRNLMSWTHGCTW